jgi:hypothetical protein
MEVGKQQRPTRFENPREFSDSDARISDMSENQGADDKIGAPAPDR